MKLREAIGWVAKSGQFDAEVNRALGRVLTTEISPELIPGDSDDKPAQLTEELVGPYALHDFNLYHVLRFGYAPSKVAFLAWSSWQDEYSLAEIRKWLRVFLVRFIETQQYKRSTLPNGPKVGSGGSLSPRGDWRAPSDGNASVWLADLKRVPTSR